MRAWHVQETPLPNNLWLDEEAAIHTGDLALRVYSSRLLGRDPALVLHGGGNTSVKVVEKDAFGADREVLYVKGSGWDLASIEAAGYTPVQLDHLRKLAALSALSDPDMVNELVTHQTRASAPVPSVEAILHALIPFKYVDHTHADAVVTITNSVDGEARIRAVYGDSVIVIPYVMPGFDLARLCADHLGRELKDGVIGMVLLNHGIFSFGATAKESYGRMLDLVGRAEAYLDAHANPPSPPLIKGGTPAYASPPFEKGGPGGIPVAPRLRKDISDAAGAPMILACHTDARSMAFVTRPDLAEIAGQGPATPDHVIRTKRLPMIGRDVEAYVAAYREYFTGNEPHCKERKSMLDPAPRVVLDPVLGMCSVGRTARDAAIVADLYRHTMDIIGRATALGGYRALSEQELFEVEYWDLEQAKLKKSGKAPEFAGEIALVTGAASGIGRACVEALLVRGAAVVGIDINPAIVGLFKAPNFFGFNADVASESAVRIALDATVETYGGLDMLVLNAGLFPGGCRIDALTLTEWDRVMRVNLDANLVWMRETHPLLKLAPRGGRVVVIGSKNVPAPGPGAAAYSASKAALNQLARVAALEWGGDNIRINSLHPNAVFDTGIWTDEVLAARARHYGLSVDEYKRNNVLKTEVTSHDVGELAAALCGTLFAKTTGAQIPVDGGNDRVI